MSIAPMPQQCLRDRISYVESNVRSNIFFEFKHYVPRVNLNALEWLGRARQLVLFSLKQNALMVHTSDKWHIHWAVQLQSQQSVHLTLS